MEQCHPVTEQVCKKIHYTERCRESREYEWADELTLMQEADRVSNMTPLCLLMTDRTRRGHTQPTLYNVHSQAGVRGGQVPDIQWSKEL